MPEFRHNLLSVGRLMDDVELIVKLDKGMRLFQDLKCGKKLLDARRLSGGIYRASLWTFINGLKVSPVFHIVKHNTK